MANIPKRRITRAQARLVTLTLDTRLTSSKKEKGYTGSEPIECEPFTADGPRTLRRSPAPTSSADRREYNDLAHVAGRSEDEHERGSRSLPSHPRQACPGGSGARQGGVVSGSGRRGVRLCPQGHRPSCFRCLIVAMA